MARSKPPEGPPWDLPLAEAPLAFVDLEMSGLDVENDRVLEVAIFVERGGVVIDSLVSLVRPEPFAYGAGEIHGIPEDELRLAPTFAELAPRIRELLEGAVFVAHGSRWDLAFLAREAQLAEIELPLGHYLDTLTLSRRAFHMTTHSLDALAKELGIDRGRAHRAEADVVVLRALFRKCIEVLGAGSPRELFGVRIAERVIRDEVKAACLEAMARKVPLGLTYRPSGKKPEDLRFMVTAVQDEPSRIIGYDVSSRARRELRGERIVAVSPLDRA
ncbi:3'-5' exonuclease [bacterium]|nr:MAG: 3'-5' exonuclease [bacterium]